MEPSSQLLLLLTTKIGITSISCIGKPDRQAGQDSVYYRISNSTHIAKVPMRRLLSHSKTKNVLSSYLAEKFLDHAMKTNLRVFVAWGC